MKLPMLALGAVAIATLGGCTTGYYGSGGVSLGYGAPGYNGWDGYGGYGYGQPYYGWYGDYYYPGSGFYVYDSYRRPYRWNYDQQRYWEGRGRAWRGNGRPESWGGFDRRPLAQDVPNRKSRGRGDGAYTGNWQGQGGNDDALTGGPRSVSRGQPRGDGGPAVGGQRRGDDSWAGNGRTPGDSGGWQGNRGGGGVGVTIGGRGRGDGGASGGGRRGGDGGGRRGGGGRSGGNGGNWGGGRN